MKSVTALFAVNSLRGGKSRLRVEPAVMDRCGCIVRRQVAAQFQWTGCCPRMKSSPEWKSWQYSSYDNPFIKNSEIDQAKNDLPEATFLQE